MAVPLFNDRGNLPPGVHPVEWQELASRFAGTARRRWLLEGLREAIKALAAAGCSVVYVDGSFATTKLAPNDYDACWSMDGVRLGELRLAEPVFFDFTRRRAAQKARFRGELFPADLMEAGSGKAFLEFFQTDPDSGEEKGLLEIQIAGLIV